MDKIEKALNRLTKKERTTVKQLLQKLKNRDLLGLDIKKLRGREDIFRIRKGRIRIIYRIDDTQQIFILTIERRNNKTYK